MSKKKTLQAIIQAIIQAITGKNGLRRKREKQATMVGKEHMGKVSILASSQQTVSMEGHHPFSRSMLNLSLQSTTFPLKLSAKHPIMHIFVINKIIP